MITVDTTKITVDSSMPVTSDGGGRLFLSSGTGVIYFSESGSAAEPCSGWWGCFMRALRNFFKGKPPKK